jgi:hypothetical protein
MKILLQEHMDVKSVKKKVTNLIALSLCGNGVIFINHMYRFVHTYNVLNIIDCLESIKKVRGFMFADVEKSLKLAEYPDIGAPNFLLALGICCHTEYWGKFLNGSEQIYKKRQSKHDIGYSTKCFNDFFYQTWTILRIPHKFSS